MIFVQKVNLYSKLFSTPFIEFFIVGFATKSKLTIHLDVHFRRNTVDCEICGKTFAAKSGYRVHLKKVSNQY